MDPKTHCGSGQGHSCAGPADLHPCPYQADVNDDSEFLCDCCENATQECADDI